MESTLNIAPWLQDVGLVGDSEIARRYVSVSESPVSASSWTNDHSRVPSLQKCGLKYDYSNLCSFLAPADTVKQLQMHILASEEAH